MGRRVLGGKVLVGDRGASPAQILLALAILAVVAGVVVFALGRVL